MYGAQRRRCRTRFSSSSSGGISAPRCAKAPVVRARARAADVVRELRVRPVVIQKRPDVQQVVNVVAQIFQIARELRRPIDVAVNHVGGRNAGRAQRLPGRAPRDFVEVRADDNQWMLVEHLPARGPLPHDGIQVREQRAVARAHVADAARLLRDGPIEDLDDDFIELLEVGLVSAAAAPHVHPAVHHRLEPARVDARHARVAEDAAWAARQTSAGTRP